MHTYGVLDYSYVYSYKYIVYVQVDMYCGIHVNYSPLSRYSYLRHWFTQWEPLPLALGGSGSH